MATVSNIRKSKKYKNYISALVALHKTGEAVETYTENGLQVVHQQIQQKLGNLPPCSHRCSELEADFNRWCLTCTRWKAELKKWLSHAARNTRKDLKKWSKLHSWEWPNNPRAIAEVFVWPGWDTNNLNLKDLSTTLMIWKRCSQFPRQLVTISNQLRTDRNNLAHQGTMSIETQRKTVIFQNIRNVLNHQDVQQSIPNLPDILKIFQELEQGDLFEYENDIHDALQSSVKLNERIDTKIDKVALGLERHHYDINRQLNEIRTDITKSAGCKIGVAIIPVMLALCTYVLMYIMQPSCSPIYSNQGIYLTSQQHQPSRTERSTSDEGCISESSVSVPLGNVSFFEYLSHHRTFVGREWLLPILKQEVFREDNYGVLIEAGMGYGKSALLAHIICATNNSVYREIRRQVIAFHVCRFDALLSKHASIFIFRLLAMLSNKIAEFADSIRTCQQIFDKSSCDRDPNGCLDHCIIIPLKNIHYFTEEPIVILLDALDECHDAYRNENPIFQLLKHRIHKFPSWVKFIVTSRFDPEIRELENVFKLIKLNDDDENNKNDLVIYYNQFVLNKSSKLIINELSNFLIATNLNDNDNLEDFRVPKTLDRYYEEQFIREFGEGPRSDFHAARCILEVLCSLFQAPAEQLILKIASYSTNYTEKELNITLQRLHNYLRTIDGKFHLNHLSLKVWLTNTNYKRFQLDINNGHRMNARFYLNKIINEKKSVSIVDLCIHVGLSADANLKEAFLNLTEIKSEILDQVGIEYPIIELAKRIDSFEITNLLTSLITDVNVNDKNNMSAIFIAASFGHLETMKALLNKGADITATTDTFKEIINLPNAPEVSLEYQYWGYGVLDIASQNGYSNIVDFILINNENLFEYPISRLNSMMLLPIHLACKRGHLKIVEILSKKFPWMLDWKCLYYASEIGNFDMVHFLLKNGVADECHLCQHHLHWVPWNAVRVQGEKLLNTTEEQKYVLFDDWSDITCESALHVAVRKNRFEIVKRLVNSTTTTVKCQDRGGRTPAISAVQYGYRDIVEYMFHQSLLQGDERCGNVKYINDMSKLHRSEIAQLQTYFCENNMPLLHLAAKFDRYWFFHIVVNKSVTLDQLDINGCHALHHAACHSSINSLTYMTTLNFFANGTEAFLCNNGSTPLHTAILCGSAASTEYIFQYSNYDKEPDDIKLKYLTLTLSVNVSGQQPNDADVIEKNVLIIFRMLIAHTSHLLSKDNNGRNILIDAILNGHYRVLSLLFSKYFVYFPNVINQKELKFAVESISHKKEFLFQPSAYFNPKVQETELLRSTYMYTKTDPVEYALLLTVDCVNKYQRLDIFLTNILIRELIKKQCVHVMYFIFLNAKNISFDQLVVLPEIVKYDKYGIISLLFYISIAHKYSDTFKEGMQEESVRNSYTCATCDLALNKCRLHEVALSYSKISELLLHLQMVQLHEYILNYMFQKSSAHAMSTCYDKGGFNVLERAIQSGSPQLVHHLLQLNVQSDLQKDKLIEVELYSLKYREEEDHFVDSVQCPNIKKIIYVSYKDYIKEIISSEDFVKTSERIKNSAERQFHLRIRNNSDWVISELIKSFYRVIPQKKICLDPASERFSIVHILAFEGYTNSLKLLVLHYGKEILKCRNWNGFTPLFMSTLLDLADTKEYIENQGITLEYPNERAKAFLQYNIATRFDLSKKNLQCIVKKNKFRVHRNNVYGLIKAYQCLKTNLRDIKRDMGHYLINDIASTWERTCKELKLLFTLRSHLDVYFNSVNDTWYKMLPFFSTKYQVLDATQYYSFKRDFLIYFQNASHCISEDVESVLAMTELEEKSCNFLETVFSKIEIHNNVAALQMNPLGWLDNAVKTCIENLCEYSKAIFKAKIYTRFNTVFEIGTVKLISNVRKEASFFSYARQFCNKNYFKIMDLTMEWSRIYPQFEYMNALKYAKTYRKSLTYMLRQSDHKEYHDGVVRAQSFLKFGQNGCNLWDQFMDRNKGG